MEDKRLGIYIHIPFCLRKCAYCNFYSLVGQDKMMPEYQAALLRHIEEHADQLDGYVIDSVYFGGGTPSHYGVTRLIELFSALKKYGHVRIDSEVTVEINPASISRDDFIRLRRAGFNRVSIGVQCADDQILFNLGRPHNFADAEKCVKDAKSAGFNNVSVDIIYGLPAQNKESWAETIARVAALKAEHISCYGLNVEEGSGLYLFKDSPFLPDDDTQADMYLYAVEMLARFGYRQYEISNFSRRGFESAHNLKYWLGEEYIGFGTAAHSHIGSSRYSFVEGIDKYIDRVNLGQVVVEHREQMSAFESAGEYLILRLRTTHGISEKEYNDIYRLKMDLILELLKRYEEEGWAVFSEGRWKFTPNGFLRSNKLIGDLLEAQTRQRAQISKPWQEEPSTVEPQMSLFDNKPVAAPLFGSRRLVGRQYFEDESVILNEEREQAK